MANNRPQRSDNPLDQLVREFVTSTRPHIQSLMRSDFPEAELRGVLHGTPTVEQRAGAVRNYVERIVSHELNQLMDQLGREQVQPSRATTGLEALGAVPPGSMLNLGNWEIYRVRPEAGEQLAGRMILVGPQQQANQPVASIPEPGSPRPLSTLMDEEEAAQVDWNRLREDLATNTPPQSTEFVAGSSQTPHQNNGQDPSQSQQFTAAQPTNPSPQPALGWHNAPPANVAQQAHPSPEAGLAQRCGLPSLGSGYSTEDPHTVLAAPTGYPPVSTSGLNNHALHHQLQGSTPSSSAPFERGHARETEDGDSSGNEENNGESVICSAVPTIISPNPRAWVDAHGQTGTIIQSTLQASNLSSLQQPPQPHPSAARSVSFNPPFSTTAGQTTRFSTSRPFAVAGNVPDHPVVPAPYHPEPARMPVPPWVQVHIPVATVTQPLWSAPPASTSFWPPVPQPGPVQFSSQQSEGGPFASQTAAQMPQTVSDNAVRYDVFGPTIPVPGGGGRLPAGNMLQLEGLSPATRTFTQAYQDDAHDTAGPDDRRFKQQRRR